MKNDTLHYSRIIDTPLGYMVAVADDEGLYSLDFTNDTLSRSHSDHPLLLQLEKELSEYFEGTRKEFSIPLRAQGTPFQQEVWKTLLTIGYGETISYAQEAERFGNPKVVRAVASANGKNPIGILIPCHRVIASGGGFGGYSGGIDKKQFLLALEQK
ncbi:MAG: methylated-DNA--[protein]-cysteine S-methyltransferase [Sulfuricurvum sp.]|uniref:methylated-DNA--[protein]-cysteine S-methyltransferase n=1 Tax=Sulfuricurvum sp. TaxID=2025608 RepID=UPI00356AFFCF